MKKHLFKKFYKNSVRTPRIYGMCPPFPNFSETGAVLQAVAAPKHGAPSPLISKSEGCLLRRDRMSSFLILPPVYLAAEDKFLWVQLIRGDSLLLPSPNLWEGSLTSTAELLRMLGLQLPLPGLTGHRACSFYWVHKNFVILSPLLSCNFEIFHIKKFKDKNIKKKNFPKIKFKQSWVFMSNREMFLLIQ